ncbi:MAG: hypothetical protein QM647_00025 [Asticcacaulis sp.]|uniref:hypothetical protein n=1 Tax=Asticcacaulis sp. TaxID=1872648 RepID=UPI0039E3D292
MALPDPIAPTDGPNMESSQSGIHWASILGGAAAAAAISALLLPLGSALGFASTNAYNPGASLITFSAGMAIWLVIMQWISSGVGGYIAGRLRVKWADTHSDEVFFRDTAHGFLAWAVATLLTLGVALCVATTVVKTGVEVADDMPYYADSLYRSSTPIIATAPEATAETARILAKGAREGVVSPADRAYLVSQVVTRTGLSQDAAEQRVSGTLTQIDTARSKALATAETTRKAMVAFHTALTLSLLIGAFIASVSAALGGKLRDNY